MAVHRNNGLLKASISTATNEQRLGADEAPPAIISVFLGSHISALLDELEYGEGISSISISENAGTRMSLSHIPEILIDNTDRNRTSPFAFTGNRFEFRAVGASANCASAMIALNSAVAYQLLQFKESVDALVANGATIEEAIFTVIRSYITESKPIRFDGNGYSEEWRAEAARRGLDCETCVPAIYDAYISPQSVGMFAATGVLSEKELHARNEVKWNVYTKKLQIEARVLGDLAMNHIIPVVMRYHGLLLENACRIKNLYDESRAHIVGAQNIALIEEIATHLNAIKARVDEMIDARKVANRIEGERARAVAYSRSVLPFFDEIRYHIDKLELIVDNEMWTLPKYRELLFLR
jgi:glutamine synthetase